MVIAAESIMHFVTFIWTPTYLIDTWHLIWYEFSKKNVSQFGSWWWRKKSFIKPSFYWFSRNTCHLLSWKWQKCLTARTFLHLLPSHVSQLVTNVILHIAEYIVEFCHSAKYIGQDLNKRQKFRPKTTIVSIPSTLWLSFGLHISFRQIAKCSFGFLSFNDFFFLFNHHYVNWIKSAIFSVKSSWEVHWILMCQKDVVWCCAWLDIGVTSVVEFCSQQGVDFSKKISKTRISFWFDFHRCSHGPSKIRRYFKNKSC